MNDDNIEHRLDEAASRLRSDAPDEHAAAEAYQQRHADPGRNWWPTVTGISLVAAALVGVVAYGAIRGDDTVVSPADPTVTSTLDPAPTTAAVVATVDTALPDDTIVTGDTVFTPDTGPTDTAIPAENPECGSVEIPPDGTQFLTVSCRGEFEAWSTLVAQVPQGESIEAATRWFVSSIDWPGVTELGPSSPVAGLPTALSFTTTLENGATCSVIIEQSLDGEWKEDCWLDAPNPEAVTAWNGELVQFDLTDPLAIIAHPLDDTIWKSSGCTAADLRELLAQSGTPGSLYFAVGCDSGAAAVIEGSIFLQPGGPDGAIWLHEQIDDTWQMVDNGTGIDTDLPASIPPYIEWTTFNGDTDPRPTSRDLDELNARPEFTGLNTLDQVRDALLALLAAERDPEFGDLALDAVYADHSLIVIEEGGGGDDAAAGVVHFVHVDRNLLIAHWYYSAMCARGGGPDGCI